MLYQRAASPSFSRLPACSRAAATFSLSGNRRGRERVPWRPPTLVQNRRKFKLFPHFPALGKGEAWRLQAQARPQALSAFHDRSPFILRRSATDRDWVGDWRSMARKRSQGRSIDGEKNFNAARLLLSLSLSLFLLVLLRRLRSLSLSPPLITPTHLAAGAGSVNGRRHIVFLGF